MANITVRELPDVIYQDIKRFAAAEHRSINSQIIHGLSEYVSRKKTAKQIIKEIKEIHSTLDVKEFNPTQEELKKIVEEGRL